MNGSFGRGRCDRRRDVGSARRRRGAPSAEVRRRDRACLRGGRLARTRAAGLGQLLRNSGVDVALRRRDARMPSLGAFRRSLRRCGGIRRRSRGPFCTVGREPVEVRFGVGPEDKDTFARLAPAPLAGRVGRRLGVACRCTGDWSAWRLRASIRTSELAKAHRGHTLACAVEQRARVGRRSVPGTRGPLQSWRDQTHRSARLASTISALRFPLLPRRVRLIGALRRQRSSRGQVHRARVGDIARAAKVGPSRCSDSLCSASLLQQNERLDSSGQSRRDAEHLCLDPAFPER